MFNRGTKFMAEFAKMCQNDYGLKRKPITTRNPKSNAIIKRIHKTIGNIIRTFDVSTIVNNDPWSGILAAIRFAVRATYHTTLHDRGGTDFQGEKAVTGALPGVQEGIFKDFIGGAPIKPARCDKRGVGSGG